MEHSALYSIQRTETQLVQSLQENAITVFGPRLYNSLPKYLRDIESVKTEKFKFEVDKFLELIPDEPKMPNYVVDQHQRSVPVCNVVLCLPCILYGDDDRQPRRPGQHQRSVHVCNVVLCLPCRLR